MTWKLIKIRAMRTTVSLPVFILENSGSQKLLGLSSDRKFNFNELMINLCDNSSRKIQALARSSLYIPKRQKQLLMNAYFMSQFCYYRLVLINRSISFDNRINWLYKRALSLAYNDFSSSFTELLEKDKSVTIH